MIRDLDPDDGYLPGEALCPKCRLVSNANLPECPVCKESHS